ncbi:MAG: presenilin family intramembrane aspartyl protease PSH [Haloarculaceae archaeon]
MPEEGGAATAAERDRAATPARDRTAASDGPAWRDWLPHLGIVVLYAATVLGGLALADEMSAMGLVMFADPGNVGNVGVFAVVVLVATGVMVLAFRFEVGDLLVRAFILASAGSLTAVTVAVVTGVGTVATGGAALGLPAGPVSGVVAVGTALVLWVYPEWWVNDLAAVVFGAAAIPMLGLGFAPLPVVVLLVLWAGYDAYAVYVSGHMQELAAGLGELRAPIVFVVPRSPSYSLREEGLELAERDGAFLDAPVLVPALNANLPALGALAGGLVGMGGLLYLVHRVEGAHAGLPPLNAGVLGGYLLGAVAAGVPVTAALGL